jgi:hypothetical protein
MQPRHDINTVTTIEQCNAEGGNGSRGLSAINKGNEPEKEVKARLLNRKTGEIIEITEELKHKFRLDRMNGRVHAWAEAVQSFGGLKGGFRYRCVMITLTYDPSVKWKAGHINNFMDGVKRAVGKGLLAYAWVSEMQLRGVPHYHAFLVVKKGTFIPTPDKPHGKRGHVLWPHGMTKIETARSPFYLVKYTGKEHQKEGFYRNMRIFAVWISKDVLSELERRKFRLSALPKWLANIARPMIDHADYEHPKPSPGGGWLFLDKLFRSEWEYQQLREGEWVNASTSLANLQYSDMTDGERAIIDFNDFSNYCKEMEGEY